MGMTFQIKEGYFGMCARMCDRDATHEEYDKFDAPIPVPPGLEDLMEPIEGVRVMVCDECCRGDHEST